MVSLDSTDIQLLMELERGVPVRAEPFLEIATRLNISEREVIDRMDTMKKTGHIRKIRARINQREMGIVANALVAWNVQKAHREQTGLLLSSIDGVTHCYERLPIPGKWDYTLYTVHHGYDREEVLSDIRSIADRIGVNDYVVLFSTAEFKRDPCMQVCNIGEMQE